MIIQSDSLVGLSDNCFSMIFFKFSFFLFLIVRPKYGVGYLLPLSVVAKYTRLISELLV